MKCPNCNGDTLIKAGTYYICEVCTEPKFKPEDVESQFDIDTFDDNLTGYRVEINNSRVEGLFKVDCIGNRALNSFKTNDVINEYNLLDKSGVRSTLKVYTGNYQPHYYIYLKAAEYVLLKEDEFKIYKN